MKNYDKELIIHPGETLKEVLIDRNTSIENLSISTGYPLHNINEIIDGKRNIDIQFAKKLENSIGIPATFWINLQKIYDEEIEAYNKNL